MDWPGKALDKRRRQLIYRANHRGIKEMDILLGSFATARAAQMASDEMDRFERMLEWADRDLLAWFTGERAAPAEFDHEMMAAILSYQRRDMP